MTDNPLPELPDELTARAIELPFEIGPEHVDLFELTTRADDVRDESEQTRVTAGLTEVVKLLWIEHVLPIEQALAESERDVAIAGRALHAAQRAHRDAHHLSDDALPDADERARQRAGTDR